MQYTCLCLLVTLAWTYADFCYDEPDTSDTFVETLSGKLVGRRQASVDPRQNKTVMWASYYGNCILCILKEGQMTFS